VSVPGSVGEAGVEPGLCALCGEVEGHQNSNPLYHEPEKRLAVYNVLHLLFT
jgi:hypothetical protein